MKTTVKYSVVLVFFLVALTACEKSEDSNFAEQEKNDPNFASEHGPTNNVNLAPNGPNDFDQVPWSVNYVVSGESVPILGDHTLTEPNPILNDFDDYVSNVPLDIEVSNTGGDWYKKYTYKLTNRSQKSMHIDS